MILLREARQRALEGWFCTDLGRHVLRLEQEMTDSKLPGLYGFHLMQLGISSTVRLYDSSVIRHKFALAAPSTLGLCSAVAAAEQLPIDSDSIDVLVLHHALEFSEQPHQLLREAARVIVPHGHLLIIGFNPWSMFGLRSLLGRRLGHPIWHGQLLAARRLGDWLALLDFAIDDIQYRCHGLPLDHAPTLDRLMPIDRWCGKHSLPGGGAYLIHARKQISPLTAIRPRRWRAPALATMPLATPSTRNTTLH
jgi:SAM-dependent methyltransferase